MQSPLISPSVTGSMAAPPPASVLLPKGVDHTRFPLHFKSPTPEVFFIFILLFSSVLGLLVMARMYPPVPCSPFSWHRRLHHCFSLYHRFIIIYRSRPLSVLRKPMGCGHGWPRARRISVCSNCGFCYIFPLGPVN